MAFININELISCSTRALRGAPKKASSSEQLRATPSKSWPQTRAPPPPVLSWYKYRSYCQVHGLPAVDQCMKIGNKDFLSHYLYLKVTRGVYEGDANFHLLHPVTFGLNDFLFGIAYLPPAPTEPYISTSGADGSLLQKYLFSWPLIWH